MAEKTNALRILDKQKIGYRTHTYEGVTSGVEVAAVLGVAVEMVYKTLVTIGRSGEHYVFVIPVAAELDLKRAALAAGEKAVDMEKSKNLLPLTGYIHGGCSPIGMKKPFRTFFDASVTEHDTIYISGGRIGLQVAINPKDLAKAVKYEIAELIV